MRTTEDTKTCPCGDADYGTCITCDYDILVAPQYDDCSFDSSTFHELTYVDCEVWA